MKARRLKTNILLTCAVMLSVLTMGAEAANFGAGGSDQWLSDAVLNKTDATKWATSHDGGEVTADNSVVFHGVKFKIVAVDDSNAGKNAKVTLWSYDTDETLLGTSVYNSSGYWGSDISEVNKAYANSDLKVAMDNLYTTLFAEDSRIQKVTLADDESENVKFEEKDSTNIIQAYVWAPSHIEIADHIVPLSGTTTGTWGFSNERYYCDNPEIKTIGELQRGIGFSSFTRTPYKNTVTKGAFVVEWSGVIIFDEPVDGGLNDFTYVLRPALQIVNQIPYAFSAKTEIATDGVFAPDGDSGTATNYGLNSDAEKPVFDPATEGITLDGTKIGINVTDSSTSGYVTTALLTKEGDETKNNKWENLNGENATSTEGIAYMAQVKNNGLDLQNVDAGTDYTLKIFGMNTNSTGTDLPQTVTQLADNSVTGLSRGSDGKIHLKIGGTYNSGVAVSLKNGAVLDLAGDAANDINLTASDTGKLNMNTYTYSGKVSNGGTLTVEGTGTFAPGTGSANSGTIDLKGGTLGAAITNNGTVKLNGGTLGGAYVTTGTLEFAANMEINANYISTATNIVDSGVTVTFTEGTLNNAITNNGTVKLNGGTLGGEYVRTGTLEFAKDIEINADYISTATNKVDSGITVTFTEGTLNNAITNNGTVNLTGISEMKAAVNGGELNINQNLTTSADNIGGDTNNVAADKILELNAGTLDKAITNSGTVKLNGGTLGGAYVTTGTLEFAKDIEINANYISTATNTVDSGVTVTFTEGTLANNITGDGTTEFDNTVTVADGVNLGTATNNVNGTLDVAGNITAGNINFKSGSTLQVDGTKITDAAAISGLTSAIVESGSKLYIKNAEKDTQYKILAGSGLDVQSWQTDADMGNGFKARYGLMVDVDNIVNDGSEFNIQFKIDKNATGSSDIGNIIADLSDTGQVKDWIEVISTNQDDIKIQGNTVNTMANMAQLANVQAGTMIINQLASENIWNNRDILIRPALNNRAKGSELKNVSANADDHIAVKVVEQGQANAIMPEQNKDKVYEKEVWASYIHSKQKIDGRETGHLTQNSTIQYNGVTAGADLWSGKHGFGGVALTYADGNTNSCQKVSSVKGDADYYGLTIYNRQDTGKFSVQYDGGYTRSKNDVTMSTPGAKDVTATPKVDIYNAGVRAETSYKISNKAEIVPFAGLRYAYVKTKDYSNDLGMGYDVDSQNMWTVPIGVALRNDFGLIDGWWMGSTLEAGYVWNLGDRDSEQRITYGNAYDVVGFTTADKGQYFVNGALWAKRDNLSAEVGYRYSKGHTTRDSRWNLNVNWGF